MSEYTCLPKSVQDEQVRKFFPKAMRQQDVVNAVVHLTHDAGIDRNNTLFSHSVCPDEINHDEHDITERLRDHFESCFSLGGLAGIPFTGKTGFGAFAAHVPDNGNIFLLFAPHCGVSKEGCCGLIHRRGQAGKSTACGAAIGAYGAVKDLKNPPPIDLRDF